MPRNHNGTKQNLHQRSKLHGKVSTHAGERKCWGMVTLRHGPCADGTTACLNKRNISTEAVSSSARSRKLCKKQTTW